MDNGNMPAMPINFEYFKNGDSFREISNGLTKREHFAGLAMQGLLASGDFADVSYTAVESVKQADALLKALEE